MQAVMLGTVPKTTKVKIIEPSNQAPIKELETEGYVVNEKFTLFWDLMDTIKIHGYVRASISTLGRTTVGTWWKLKKNLEFKSQARELHRKKLLNFYNFSNRDWTNIKDFYSLAYKLMIAAMYLKYFGQAAFHIVRDGTGNPIGLDFMHGFVVPNVDEEGYFKEVAFMQYMSRDTEDYVEYTDIHDIVYIVNPDWEGYPTGGTDLESVTDFALPLDIYLQTAAREYVRNRSTPEAFYILSPDISDEAFDDFVDALESKYGGASNVGKNPVVVQGELQIENVSRLPEDLPYQEARNDTRTETLAVTGTPGAKLGIDDSISSGGLRELRREFHETTMVPIFKLIENALYEQIHVREFGIIGWEFKFNKPDFLTAVEQATVHMRYHSLGVYNPNEIRNQLGEEPRDDENGDLYVDQVEEVSPQSNTPLENPDTGSPPEGREPEPDDPSETGEPTNDDQDPPRGDNHDDEERALVSELKKFKSFAINRVSKGKALRVFESDIIPDYMVRAMTEEINQREADVETVKSLFDYLIGEMSYAREKSNRLVLH
jgi:hypothetical protein